MGTGGKGGIGFNRPGGDGCGAASFEPVTSVHQSHRPLDYKRKMVRGLGLCSKWFN